MSSRVQPDLAPESECVKNVDTLLRCPICFDFLNIAMMTTCSHNFCSLCIRKFLCFKLQCPLCNTPMTEQDLRNNRLVDDLVVNFQAARQQLSKVHFDSPPVSPKTPTSAVKRKAVLDGLQKSNGTVLSHFFQKRPKTDASSTSGSSERGRGKRAAHLTPGPAPAAVKLEPEDVEEASPQQQQQRVTPVKQEVTGSHQVTPEHSSAPPQDVKPVIKVDCPVCSVGVAQEFINKHLDMCLARGEKKECLRSCQGKTRRRPMAKLVYNLLSQQELKRRLKECHLSAQGPREQLVRRHQEFLQIYNAQCDALNPKSAEEIAKEVEANEKIRNGLNKETKPVMVFTKNHTEQEIEEMHSNYRKQHSSDFSRLIAQVRGRLVTMKQSASAAAALQEEERTDTTDRAAASRSSEGSSAEAEEEQQQQQQQQRSALSFSPTASPTHSDVSISSSISDVFGPDPVRTVPDREESQGNPAPKPAAMSRRKLPDWSPPAPGKRRRKK